MKQFARGLYLAVCYILGLPILFVGLAVLIIVTVGKDAIDGYGVDFRYAKDLVGASIEGIKMGHERNVKFVKYGPEWYLEEQES